ncbi:MAG TPA: tetratricopeptide repeat protein [Bryobacteraceae bacterium]|nr:tetratricopeptide repeat protein [Bryobacteraceae bacterium]
MRFAVALCLIVGPLFAAPETELKDASGHTVIRYVVEAPENVAPANTKDPARQVGLILCSAEHNRPTGDEIYPVREALRRLGMSDQFILLAGHSQALKFSPADDAPLEQLMRWAMKTYPVNPRRVYMYGKGEGSKISAEFTMLHPNLVTASIGYSWGFWRMPSETETALDYEKHEPELYMVLGLRDLSYHLTTVRDAYQRALAKGYHVIYREFDDLGARTYHPESNDDAIAWATRLRNKTLPLSREEEALLAKPQINADGYYGNVALVGGAPAGVVVRRLLASNDANVRAAAAETCAHAIFDEPAMAALGKLTSDSSPKVRRAAFHALALNADWRSAASQKALIEFALNPANGVEDREAAVDAIAYAIRLQIHGVRQDPELFKALVMLLGDQNEEVHTMATNLLATVRDPGFRGDLGRPEQKEPAGGWQNWLAAVTSKANDYRDDYKVCGVGEQSGEQSDAIRLFCAGQSTDKPAAAFESTRKAAELGYVPAEAMLGMEYAIGKGVQQNYQEAANWWLKAAEGGHPLAAQSISMIYRGGAGVKSDQALSAKWAKMAEERRPANQ